jgi:hypothetical protein
MPLGCSGGFEFGITTIYWYGPDPIKVEGVTITVPGILPTVTLTEFVF